MEPSFINQARRAEGKEGVRVLRINCFVLSHSWGILLISIVNDICFTEKTLCIQFGPICPIKNVLTVMRTLFENSKHKMETPMKQETAGSIVIFSDLYCITALCAGLTSLYLL